MTATHLTAGSNETNQVSYDTASISPGADKLVIISVYSAIGAGAPVTPTVTGCNLTWVEVNNEVTSTTKVTMFRAMGSSPSSGALTIDFGAESQSRCLWQVTEFGEVITTGANGADAVVQVADIDSISGVTTLTVTLSAFADTKNATYGVLYKNVSEATTVGTDFTELAEETGNANASSQSQYKLTNDTSVDWTWTTSASLATAMAIEINTAVPASGGYIHISN